MTRQASCNFIPKTAEGDIIGGVNGDSSDAERVYVSKMVAAKTEKLENGNEVQSCELSEGHTIGIPLRNYYSGCPSDIQIYNNNIYVISGEGFFKAKLTANKFTQMYGISKLSGMQDTQATFALSMKSETEIYLMTKKTIDDVTSYGLQACKIG